MNPLPPAPGETRPPSHPAWPVYLGGLALVIVALAAYHNSLRGPFVFDDLPAILDNPTLGHFSTALFPATDSGSPVSGRPVINLSFAANLALGGTSVGGFHLVNLAIHVFAGLTLYGIVRRTLLRPVLRDRFAGGAQGAALIAAAIWLVHPLQTESVTYISQRAESLMGLFYLLTLYFFIRGIEPGARAAWLWLSAAACLLGMASKEVMASVPLLVLLYDRTFVAGNFREAWRRRKWFYAGLAATWVPLGLLVASTANRGGTAGFGGDVTAWAYALTQLKAIALYLRLALWPHPLVLDYGAELVGGINAVLPQALLVLLLLAGTAVALWRRPVLGFMGAWFFAILAPSSSIVPIATQTIAEHRVYLALASPIALFTAGLFLWLGRRGLIVGGVAIVLGFAALTVQRNEDYQSALGLWTDTVAKHPSSARAQLNLGNELMLAGRLEDAMSRYREAVRLRPAYTEAHYNLGNALLASGRSGEAIQHYEEALRLNPALADVHYNLGNALAQAGREAEAMAQYVAAIRLKPDHAKAHFNLGNSLAAADRLPEAIAQYEAALQVTPDAPDIHENLGNALAQAGRTDEALSHYRTALRSEPGNAGTHNNLGTALLMAGRPGEAIAEYEAALRLKPDYLEARQNLGEARRRAAGTGLGH